MASVVLPSSASAGGVRTGETYYFVQCGFAGTHIMPKQGTSDQMKNAAGAVVSRFTITENQCTAIMWDGAYWRVLPF